MNPRYDAIIIGARVAGASTAMLLARAGLRVLAVDRGEEGSDTLSTHALMRAGVLQLHRWGVLDALKAAGTPPVRTTTFHYADEVIPVFIKPRDGVDALYAPRRTVLDSLLVESARAAGAEVRHRVVARDLVRDATGRATGVALEPQGGAATPVFADLVIGADGHHSRMARWTEAPVEAVGSHTVSVVYGYFAGLPADGFHWHYAPGVSVGVIPTNGGLTCVFAALPPDRFRAELPRGLESVLGLVLREASPALAEQVAGARREGKLWSFPGMPGYLRRPYGPGWALVGDAGYFRDPITAHGITDALIDAEILARAVIAGDISGYATARDTRAPEMLRVSDAIASFAWNLESAKNLHLELSRHMNAELDTVRGFEAAAVEPPRGDCPATLPWRRRGGHGAGTAAPVARGAAVTLPGSRS